MPSPDTPAARPAFIKRARRDGKCPSRLSRTECVGGRAGRSTGIRGEGQSRPAGDVSAGSRPLRWCRTAPFAFKEVADRIAKRQIGRNTLAWKRGAPEWRRADAIAEPQPAVAATPRASPQGRHFEHHPGGTRELCTQPAGKPVIPAIRYLPDSICSSVQNARNAASGRDPGGRGRRRARSRQARSRRGCRLQDGSRLRRAPRHPLALCGCRARHARRTGDGDGARGGLVTARREPLGVSRPRWAPRMSSKRPPTREIPSRLRRAPMVRVPPRRGE